MCLVVRSAYVSRHPAAVRDVVAVGAGPVPDLGGARTAARRGGLATTPRAGADLAAMPDVARERFAQQRCVLVVQVDLVRRAVQAERHGLGGFAAVEIVDQDDADFL